MDALKLEQRAVDEVQPLIYDLSDRLNKVCVHASHFRLVEKGEGKGGGWRACCVSIAFCVPDLIQSIMLPTISHGHEAPHFV